MTSMLRTFCKQDSEAVVNLWSSCELTRSWNNPHKDIERKLDVNDELFIVAVQDDRIVGTVMGGYDGHRGWINYLAVDIDYRRSGLGRELMGEVEARLFALGCPKINLQIRSDNTAVIAFYQAIGFVDDNVQSFGKRLIPDN